MTDEQKAGFAERLLNVDSCAVSDTMDSLGLKGTVAGLGPVSVAKKIAGPVLTVLLGPPAEDIPKRHLCTAAIEAGGPGDIIVVKNRVRPDAAGWGGLLSTAALEQGIAGTIVDGPARDVDESRELGYPVYASAAISFTARGRTQEHAWNETIEVGEVTVEPGDWVIADGSGVVFIPQARLAEVVQTAEEIAAKEAAMAAAVRSGKAVSAVLGGDYEKMLIKS
jgi:regulator of RNase E activity RraA